MIIAGLGRATPPLPTSFCFQRVGWVPDAARASVSPALRGALCSPAFQSGAQIAAWRGGAVPRDSTAFPAWEQKAAEKSRIYPHFPFSPSLQQYPRRGKSRRRNSTSSQGLGAHGGARLRDAGPCLLNKSLFKIHQRAKPKPPPPRRRQGRARPHLRGANPACAGTRDPFATGWAPDTLPACVCGEGGCDLIRVSPFPLPASSPESPDSDSSGALSRGSPAAKSPA